MKASSSSLALVALLVALTLPSAASAQSKSPVAEGLFTQGRMLFEAGRFEEACPKFRESDRIEPAIGSKLNLALCEENLSHTATAWALFRVIVQELSPSDPRLTLAQHHLDALAPRVPHVIVRLQADSPPDTSVVLGEVVLQAQSFAAPLAVDPGLHRLVIRAPGRQDAESSVEAKEGATSEVEVEAGPLLPAPVVAAPVAPARSPVALEPPRAPIRPKVFTPLRVAAVGTGGAGFVALITGGVFAIVASNQNQHSNELGCQDNRCPPPAKNARLDALANADRATGFAIVGSVLVAGGAVLWLVGAPKDTVQVGASFVNGAAQASVRGVLP